MTTLTTARPARPGHRARSASAAALLTLSAAGAGLALTAAPALAHDQLLSTTPEAGATVSTAPTELSLTFSGDLIAGQGIQNLVTVTDEAGHQWQDGDANVSGPTLGTALCDGLPNGEFDVAYRVVYSDGHSEAQQYSFTVDDPQAPDTAVPEDCGVPNPDAPVSDTGEEPTSVPAGSAADPAADPASDAEATAESAASGLPAWAWGAAVVGVLLVAAAVLLVFRRARAIDAPASEPRTED